MVKKGAQYISPLEATGGRAEWQAGGELREETPPHPERPK